MMRHEYIDFCKSKNGTTLTVVSEAHFGNVKQALLKWVNGTKESRDLVYKNKAEVNFWTSSMYDSEVRK